MRTKIIKLWAAGISTKEIAEKLGVSENCVNLYVFAHRDKCPKRKNSIDTEELVKLWNEGKPSREIAEILGISEITVRMYVSTHRDICKYRRTRKVDKNKIVDLYNAGKTSLEIAETLGVSVGCIRGHLLDNNLIDSKNYKIDHEKFVEAWNNGVLSKDLAEMFNICEGYVWLYAHNHRTQCPARKQDVIREIDHDEFVRLWNSGINYKEIAKELGVKESYVNYYAYRNREDCPKRK